MTKRFILAVCLAATLARAAVAAESVVGDSLVLAGDTSGLLLAEQINPNGIVVHSSYLAGGGITYEPGRDYVVDAKAGSIARTSGSRIPDFSTNMLFGRKDFDQSQFPGYGNGKFFVYVDYVVERPLALVEPRDVTESLARTKQRLQGGQPVKVIAFGDSITAGGEASSVE